MSLLLSIVAFVLSLIVLYLALTKDKPRHDVPKEPKPKKTIYRWTGKE